MAISCFHCCIDLLLIHYESFADYGMLTILKTCNVGGLQIHLDGTWINVEAVDGFIVNLGKLRHDLGPQTRSDYPEKLVQILTNNIAASYNRL